MADEQRDIKIAQLFSAAASGSLPKVKALVAEGVNPSNLLNHDHRSVLHIAAAEGRSDVIKYLVEEVHVPLDTLDRWGNSALSDALRSGNEEVAIYLHKKGCVLNLPVGDAGRELTRAAAEGSVLKVQFLVESGVDVNSADCDGRTALHLAAAAGNTKICEILLHANADVTVADRWGATPISDAVRFKHFELAQVLRTASSKVSDLEAYKTSEQFISSIHQAIRMLCVKDNWAYGTAWLVNNGEARVCEVWSAATQDVPRVAEWRQQSESTVIKIDKNTSIGNAALTNTSQWVGGEATLFPQLAAQTGFKSGLILPVLINGVLLCILELRSFESLTKTDELIEHTFASASRMIVGNLRHMDGSATIIRGFLADQMNEVFRGVLAAGIFTESVVRKEIDWYFTGLGMHEFYWRQFSTAQITQHVMAFIAAKLQTQTTGVSIPIRYRSEDDSSGLYIYPVEEAADVEHRIESRWLSEGYQGSKPVPISPDHGVSVKYFLTSGTASPDSTQKLAIFVVSTNKYVVDPTTTKVDKETSVWKIGTGSFLCEKSFQARERYENALRKALNSRVVVVEMDRPTQRAHTSADSMVITCTYKRGSTHSFLSSMSQLLNRYGLLCLRKYVETFANGYLSYSFHVRPSDSAKLDEVLRLAALTWMLPRTSLSPLVDQGLVDLPTAQWAYVGWKFVYHFLASTSDEWTSVWEMAKNDVNSRAQLLKLKKRMQNELATETRIAETILENPELISEMYQDFKASFDPANGSAVVAPKFNEALWAKIVKTVVSPVDQEILRTLLKFNQYTLKTNFYKAEKTALCFRLNPAFLADCDYQIIPYGLFLVVGAEFRGFHVRFDDVARGGIRMIKSRTKQFWQRNAEGLFDENYNLAYTQTLKNKDIPESGSKGTVFLNVDHQDKDEIAFQKYVDGILDVILLPSNEVVDHLHSQEILFFGPDEGTAHFMDWAALHSRDRGYKFWSALTTGKSEALGGIPHDVFGMTTRGVHQYVLGIIRKLGLDETQLRKLQTGGPDGDLGSNEIKISKDKTIAIVDGSGVLYDPEGINRAELLRLAEARKMINNFDRSLLGPKGFCVLIDDKDVVLPDGRVVDNGMNFRNNFHVDPLASADLFVPCGGRPAAVNLSNVDRLFIGPDRKPIFKYVVEGANLFFTQEARLKLEEAGVILFKDASANKGGVTSSSSEVLASLCMNDEEYHRLMCIKDGVVPEFYKRYVVDVQNKIEGNATLEFECIWAESQRDPTIPRCILTDKLSQKINQLNYQIRDSGLWDDQKLVKQMLAEVISPSLQQELGLERIMERLPKAYIESTLSSYLAARYVYTNGLKANEFAFYQFMAKYRS